MKHIKLPFDTRQRQGCGHACTALAGRYTANGAPSLHVYFDFCSHHATEGAGHLLCIHGLINVVDRGANDHQLHDDRQQSLTR